MPQILVEMKKLHLDAVAPKYQSDGAGGADFHAHCPDGPVHLQPGETKRIGTGIALFIGTPDWELLLMPRSGLGSKGIILANTVGLIDSDYQGEIGIMLYNRSDAPFVINNGDRIAQGTFVPVAQARFMAVDEFSKVTGRGEGGFGSTGGFATAPTCGIALC